MKGQKGVSVPVLPGRRMGAPPEALEQVLHVAAGRPTPTRSGGSVRLKLEEAWLTPRWFSGVHTLAEDQFHVLSTMSEVRGPLWALSWAPRAPGGPGHGPGGERGHRFAG